MRSWNYKPLFAEGGWEGIQESGKSEDLPVAKNINRAFGRKAGMKQVCCSDYFISHYSFPKVYSLIIPLYGSTNQL
jgi:hypothetical protein